VTRDDGSERSIWPHKWPLSFIKKIAHTRSALKNFWNDPAGNEGGYWSVEDFTEGELDNPTLQVLSIDPTVTTKTTSDPAGVAVVSYAPGYVERGDGRRVPRKVPSRCSIDYARQVRYVGEKLRAYVLRVLAAFPRVRLIVVEGNQAGENWHAILHDMPVRVVVVWSTVKKEVRAANLLGLYQSQPTRVLHSTRLPALIQEMCSFPKGRDDLVDAVGAVVLRLLAPRVKGGTVFPS
jgi:phage terminase large subunit-like protein